MSVRLEPYRGSRSRYRCPKCGEPRKFTRYIDEYGQYIADDVGRCDREDRCGYHKTPKEHYQSNPMNRDKWREERPKEIERSIDTLPLELMVDTLKGYERNNFFLFLRDLVGEDAAKGLMAKYTVGTSRHWPGATVFWQVDAGGRVRQLKLMLYDPNSGKRVKSDTPAMRWDYISGQYREDVGGQDKSLIYGKFIQGGRFKHLNLQQCLFGEHLLRNDGQIAIVESEKTAIIASHYFPDLTWIATGGSNGAGFTKPQVCKVLRGREIVLFPDLGQFDKWTEKAGELQKAITCKVIVSDLLEAHAGETERKGGWDLADYLMVENQSKINDTDQPEKPGQWHPVKGAEF